MYPPNPPTDGIYRVKLLAAEQDDTAYNIRYDISVGPCVGWATYKYQQTGKWPLVWRLDKHRGTTAIRCAQDALNRSTHAHWPYMSGAPSPDGRKIYRCQEVVTDSREGRSPMVNWCAEHGIIILPQYLPAGGYTVANSNVIVDRKDNILELHKDFAGSQNRGSYQNAALCAQVIGKRLVYVVSADRDDCVEQISDLAHWRCTIKNQTFVGTHLYKQILRHQVMYPHVSFVFVKKEKLCQTIWNVLSK